MTLEDAKLGKEYKVLFVSQADLSSALLQQGLQLGKKLKVISRAPFGGPVYLTTENNTAFFLNRKSSIKVELELI